KPVDTRTLRPGGTNTSLDWTGRKRNGFTWRIAIRNGSGGRELAHILDRRSRRSLHFDAHYSDWRDSLENCGGPELICVTWTLEAGWGCAIPTKGRRHGRSMRGWSRKWCANSECTCCWSRGARLSLRPVCF